ncbi:segregation/condensation protein A [Clostridium sp. MSJ-4]|uniref:Segregation and condensation protein A n=1 Tax=Clostridium simiarum TaxID=2841506 RepID=A0ABS6EYC0_9CLOT|nr:MULTISPECIES: segregation/condensation protein A [Clostridium]MBU5590735.1 segregation/condensation protein A [Clostridium simiarum]
MNGLNIKISNFEGPFDLLLHLIKKNEMDIYNVKIHQITNQYIQYIKEMQELDLEVTSEFIVMAATLIEIKSRMLLPKMKNSEEEENYKEDLVEKLIEYKKFKKAAEYFRKLKGETGEVYSKKPEIIEEKTLKNNEELLKDITMLELYNLYSELIQNYINKRNTNNVIEKEIPIDRYKIEDKMEHIKIILTEINGTTFSEIMNRCDCKLEVVVTFLALLELIKEKFIKVVQEDNFSRIYIERMALNEGHGL